MHEQSLIFDYILSSLIYCIISIPIYIILRLIWCKSKHKSFNWQREITLFLFVEFMVVFISQTLYPLKMIYYWVKGTKLIYGGNDINLIPFKSISSYLLNAHNISFEIIFINIFANILITIPIGFFLPLLWQKFHKFWRTFLHTSILIIAVELIQPFFLRSTDIDDYILNISGVIIGYVIWEIVIARRTLVSRGNP